MRAAFPQAVEAAEWPQQPQEPAARAQAAEHRARVAPEGARAPAAVEAEAQPGREPQAQAAREAQRPAGAAEQVTEAAEARVATVLVAGSSARRARRRRTPVASARVLADAARTHARMPETAPSVRVSSGAWKVLQRVLALSPSCGRQCPATSASSRRPRAVTSARTYRATAARKRSSRSVRGRVELVRDSTGTLRDTTQLGRGLDRPGPQQLLRHRRRRQPRRCHRRTALDQDSGRR